MSKKKILLLGDNLLLSSGVGGVLKEIVYGTAHIYDWIQLGAAINPPNVGEKTDLSKDVNKEMGIDNASVFVISNKGFGNAPLIRSLMKSEKPDLIFMMGDPRLYDWFFSIENEIRKKCPVVWYNIWDSPLVPYFNSKFYESCDGLFCISKQTKNLVEMALDDKINNKLINYIPHGVNPKYFFPLNNELLIQEYKKLFFDGKTPEFVVLFNSRNIRRKSVPDLLLAWRLFCDSIGEEKSKETALLLHTDPYDNNGTNLFEVHDTIFGDHSNVHFTKGKFNKAEMNILYNIADVTVLPSSNEGWGLSLTESLMAGTMVIGNVTGGIQDQMRFEDENGKWIDFNKEFLSNHFGKYKKCGNWAKPIFPRSMSLLGSIPTPYIYDDRCDFRDLASSIEEVYNMDPNEREINGLNGKVWVESDESGMSTNNMCSKIIKGIETILSEWKPKKSFELVDTSKLTTKINKKILY